MSRWTFILTDRTGNQLADLSTAAGRTLTFKRNTYTEVQFTISHEDDAASLLLTALATTGVPKLKLYRRGANDPLTLPAPLKFRGPLVALQEVSGETSLITATFRSPFGVLMGDGDKGGRFLSAATTNFSATDAGAIAKALIDTANTDSATGLATDAARITATKTRDRSYTAGQNIGTAITDLSATLDGFDFYETYVDGVGTIDAYFNVAASQGASKPLARFEYGPQTLNNVQSLERDTLPPMNAILVTGGNGLVATYTDAASVATYGKWWGHFDYSDISEQALLNDKAKALVRPNPVKTLKFVPELALSPVVFDDWNLGDTVPFLASRGALSENAQLRINSFTLPIDENGYETVQVEDPTSPEGDAFTRAQLEAEVVNGTSNQYNTRRNLSHHISDLKARLTVLERQSIIPGYTSSTIPPSGSLPPGRVAWFSDQAPGSKFQAWDGSGWNVLG